MYCLEFNYKNILVSNPMIIIVLSLENKVELLLLLLAPALLSASIGVCSRPMRGAGEFKIFVWRAVYERSFSSQ